MKLESLNSYFSRCARLSTLLAMAMASCLTIVSCSSSTNGEQQRSPDLGPGLSDDISNIVPAVLLEMQSDPTLLAPVPEIVASVIQSTTGLTVAYTDRSQLELASPTLIEQQWIDMQTCLDIVAVAPVVLVMPEAVTPFTRADDVVRDIEGIAIASSTLAKSLLQISYADFDGSLGIEIFHLRSIMGRHLWLSQNLPERDYPFACAQP